MTLFFLPISVPSGGVGVTISRSAAQRFFDVVFISDTWFDYYIFLFFVVENKIDESVMQTNNEEKADPSIMRRYYEYHLVLHISISSCEEGSLLEGKEEKLY